MWRRWTSLRCLALYLSVIAGLSTQDAWAADGKLQVRLFHRGDQLSAKVNAPGLVDAALRERLRSGLTNHIVIDARLVEEGFAPTITEARRSISVVYDLWEENYLLEAKGAGPDVARRFTSLAAVERWLQGEQVLLLKKPARCSDKQRFHVELSLTVNPVSQKVMQRSRDLIAGAPGDREGGQSRSLFGSVARIFFNISADHGVRVIEGRSATRACVDLPRGR